MKAALILVAAYEATRTGTLVPPALLILSEGTSHESDQIAFFWKQATVDNQGGDESQ